MTRIEFDELVESLEGKFRDREAALTRSSIQWAIFGYVVLSLAITVNLCLLAGCIAIIVLRPSVLTFKIGGVLGIAAGALSLTLIRSLWNRLHPPQGREIKRGEAPALFAMIDEISAAAGGVRFHKVLLINDLNASVVQLPLAGIFGLHRNYLSLGLPLMDALEPEEFKAVLSHEFSHLSNKDGSVGNWIYRIRMTWERAAFAIFQQEGYLIAPLKKFFNWFWPRFNARAFVLSRANEYRADAFAAEVTSPATSARALQRVDLRARHLDEVFWKNIDQRVAREALPPQGIFSEMKGFLRAEPEPEMATRWLAQAFSVSTGTSDTHPSLNDRIKALGMSTDPRGIAPLREHASDALLGTALANEARDAYSREWHQTVLENWQTAHRSRAESREKLQAMSSASVGGETKEEEWERISLQLQTDGIDTVFPIIRDFAARHPEHKGASFITGSHLLEQGDAAGLPIMERLAKDPVDTLDCLGVMAGYHDRQGNHEALREIKKRADVHDDQMAAAMEARNHVSARDTFLPHGLDEEQIGKIRAVVASEKDVRAAWFVRKQHHIFENWKQYILAVDLHVPWYRFSSDADTGRVLQRLADGLEIDALVLVIRNYKDKKAVCKSIRAQQPDSAIYSTR